MDGPVDRRHRADPRLGHGAGGDRRYAGQPERQRPGAGRDLRLVWIEQGFRLENGTLNAALEDGVLVLEEMTFTGEARVPPDEPRALGALTTGQPGTLKVAGRVRCRR